MLCSRCVFFWNLCASHTILFWKIQNALLQRRFPLSFTSHGLYTVCVWYMFLFIDTNQLPMNSHYSILELFQFISYIFSVPVMAYHWHFAFYYFVVMPFKLHRLWFVSYILEILTCITEIILREYSMWCMMPITWSDECIKRQENHYTIVMGSG